MARFFLSGQFFILFFLVFNFSFLQAQRPEKIRFKKQESFVFFQYGTPADTISPGKGDLFFLRVPDSLKTDLVIYSTNGSFRHTTNDTLITFRYVSGINYETFFLKEDTGINHGKPEFSFHSKVNGASAGDKNEIIFRVFVRGQQQPLMVNRFYYAGK